MEGDGAEGPLVGEGGAEGSLVEAGGSLVGDDCSFVGAEAGFHPG